MTAEEIRKLVDCLDVKMFTDGTLLTPVTQRKQAAALLRVLADVRERCEPPTEADVVIAYGTCNVETGYEARAAIAALIDAVQA